eukprot:5070387-Amphidinium_carterae.1
MASAGKKRAGSTLLQQCKRSQETENVGMRKRWDEKSFTFVLYTLSPIVFGVFCVWFRRLPILTCFLKKYVGLRTAPFPMAHASEPLKKQSDHTQLRYSPSNNE